MSGWVQTLIVAATLCGGVGVYLMMPGGAVTSRRVGAVFALLGLALAWVIWIINFRDVGTGRGILFCLVASMTVIGGAMTVTCTNPVSCALWFTAVVIGTAGLFMLQDAQFLATAIVIVYAGAIIVMFLFVVMLAQQRGTALYDGLAREPGLAVLAGFVLLAAIVSATITTYRGDGRLLTPQAGRADVSQASALDTAPMTPQVAILGRALFAEHWLSLEVAGTMLLVAMVGAIVISARSSGPSGGSGPVRSSRGAAAALNATAGKEPA